MKTMWNDTLSSDVKVGKHYLSGAFTNGAENVFYTINPATQEPIGVIPQADISDVESAYHFARDSFYGWREYSRVMRAEYFLKLASLIEERKEEIARLITL